MSLWITQHDRIKIGTQMLIGDIMMKVVEVKRAPSMRDQVSYGAALEHNKTCSEELKVPVPLKELMKIKWWHRFERQL